MYHSKVTPLPDYLEKCKKASVEVYSLVVDTAPDIAMCNSDGYFLEIKGSKIVNSLNLIKEVGIDVHCFYFCKNEKPFIFYVVLTSNNNLLLIKRLDSQLEITKVYKEVEDYEVDDFKSLGYPQLKIYKSKGEDFVQFPIFDIEAVVGELEFETNSDSVAKLLTEKLQIVCKHVDELTEDWDNMKRLVQFNNSKENFSPIFIDFAEFSLPLEEYAEKTTILSTWIKMIGDKLVLGINIHYDGEKKISNLEFKMYGKIIKDYSYRFFSCNNSEENPLFFCEKINSSILPGHKITVVGAVLICFDDTFKRELEISCYLSSAELKNYLVRKTFEINILDFFHWRNNIFSSLKENCSVEDLQAIKTVRSEIKFKIKIKNYVNDTLESLLKDNLGFKQVKFKEDNLYYCTSKYLREVFIAVQPFAIAEQVWKCNFYASNESEICFFVNILYEFLPEYSAILLNED